MDIDNYSWTEILGFWVFLHKETLLCPFSLASFHFAWSQTMNFGLFSQDLRHYVHFRHRHLHFLQYCDLFLDIFASWCFLMSIFTCNLSLFVVAGNKFWTFFSRFAALCPFSLASFHFSWSQTMNFGLFSQELLHYVHFRHRHLRFLQYDGLSIQYPTTLICKQLKIFLKLFCHVKSPP